MYLKKNIELNDNLFEIIELNPYVLFVFEHLGYIDEPKNLTVKNFCKKNKLDERLFLSFLNIYNGNSDIPPVKAQKKHLPVIVQFLKHSHNYYKNEKYPYINNLLNELNKKVKLKEISLLKKFFEAYKSEVIEHLDYEENNVFPYIEFLIKSKQNKIFSTKFSIKDYQEHHSDIEEKLSDLKNLLIHHLSVGSNASLKRQIIFNLYELEYDLHAHSIIEDKILIPIISSIEKSNEPNL
ncbi:MAG TPA: hemerythrin domain-containing protein [Bacteroidales bacterium]|jgi:regulator of cell morphogenesis and NO signaling|nr:hemerythrin domain-containing protein [Bacteroidales bacterium]